MSWTLLMADDEGNPLEESTAVLDDELAEYLRGIEGFPYLRGLRGMTRSEETFIDEEAREALAREAAALAARARRREVPRPPDWVGLEGTGDLRLGEELGWRGLLDFLQRLEHLLHLARRMGLDLWAVPEE
ncbi:MAG TPA: hypothetical protein VIC28_00955 [Thermoanaerobaculia bacterium]